jgi:hypothetical protein
LNVFVFAPIFRNSKSSKNGVFYHFSTGFFRPLPLSMPHPV